jgi:hypothetical protein
MNNASITVLFPFMLLCLVSAVFRQYKIQLTVILFFLYEHHLHNILFCPHNSIQKLQMQPCQCESHVSPNHASQGMFVYDQYPPTGTHAKYNCKMLTENECGR